MRIELFLDGTFDTAFSPFNTPETLVLSTSKRRYRNTQCHVVQCEQGCEALFKSAVDGFYADTIIIDLLDEWAVKAPKALGAFLDDFEEGMLPDTKLVLVLKNKNLIEAWELTNVQSHF